MSILQQRSAMAGRSESGSSQGDAACIGQPCGRARRPTISDLGLGRQDLAATVFARFQVDVMRPAALARLLVLDIDRAPSAHPPSGGSRASCARLSSWERPSSSPACKQSAQARGHAAARALSAAGLIAAFPAHGQRLSARLRPALPRLPPDRLRTQAALPCAARMRSSRLSARRCVPGPGLPACRSKGLGSETASRAASRGVSSRPACRNGSARPPRRRTCRAPIPRC